MAHYRRGHKVPAMATRQRDIAGLLTVVFVFVLVAAAAWRPLWFALPSLVVVAALLVFDHAIVDIRDTDRATDTDAETAVYARDVGVAGLAGLAAAQTRAYPVSPNAPTARRVSPPMRPASRRASWLDDPVKDPLNDVYPPNDYPVDDVSVPTAAVDMRAFLD